MKLAINLYKAVFDSLFLWITGGILLAWGYIADGWIRMGAGCIFIFLAIRVARDDYRADRQLDKWLKENEGRIIFFYPAKKEIQERIRAEIIPLFETEVLQAYYDGPKIAGDLEPVRYLLRRITMFNPKIRPNNPSIIEIRNGALLVKDELALLMGLDGLSEIDKAELKKRIKRACG